MTAFDRVIKALDAAGRRPRVYGDKATAHCPGPGHWRGDQIPSLRITNGDGRALVYCHGLCNVEDVLAAIDLTKADLFDEPRPVNVRINRKRLHAAIGRARGLTVADRYVYTRLVDRSDWATAVIPAAFQPRGLRGVVAADGIDLDTVQRCVAHLAYHGWLTLACGAKDCSRTEPHPGRGHRIMFGFPGIGDDCPGRPCPHRNARQKYGRSAHLRLVGGALAVVLVAMLAGTFPSSTCLQHKPAADLRRPDDYPHISCPPDPHIYGAP